MKLKILTFLTFTTMLLSSCGTIAGDPLDGTAWELYTYGSTHPIEGSITTISFENGQLSGRGGCNQYGGEYQISGSTIRLDKLYMTEMACLSPEGIMQQEQDFLQYLGDAQRFEMTEGQLQIYGTDGETLTFVPMP
ncbi:MAG: META domain-containing protein [Anaerolineales bacterium]